MLPPHHLHQKVVPEISEERSAGDGVIDRLEKREQLRMAQETPT